MRSKTRFKIQKTNFNAFKMNKMSSAHKSARMAKNSISKLKGIIEKISYERRDDESVDEKSLS